MIRNIKALGLALVAVCALGAMAASAAWAAEGKITSDGAVTLKGTETGAEGTNSLSMFEQTKRCPGSTYTGHKINSTSLIASGETSATLTPTYVNCIDQVGRHLTVDMNGCDYVLKDFTLVSAGTYSVLVDIVCPAGASIETTGGFCTDKVPAQTGKSGFHLTNTGSGTTDDVDLTGEITTITATACNGLLHTTSARWRIDKTFKGFNGSGVETGVTISG